MLRQVAEIGPDGRTRIVYVACGPRSAVKGHGRPLSGTYALVPDGIRNAAPAGAKQPRLGVAA